MPLPMNAQHKGAMISWPIGRRGEGALDIHPGRINSVGPGYDDQGRQGLVVEAVFLTQARPENGGQFYFRIRKILERFVFPRTGALADIPADAMASLDAVDIDALYEQAATAGLEYLASQAQGLDALAEAALAAEVPAETTTVPDEIPV
jgi:hypothetical protein